MNAATVHALPAQQDRVIVALTADERAAIASACLGMAVQMFAGADRLEAQGMWTKADALRHDALLLSRAELSVRNASR